MIPQARKYFLVTVHYASDENTNTLLSSIKKNTYKPDKVVVVDHAVSPFKPLIDGLPLTIIRPAENSGYGGGINVAAGHLYGAGARGEDVMIVVNDDIILPEDAIDDVVTFYQDKEVRGVYGPVVGIVDLITGRTSLAGSAMWPWQKRYVDGACFAVDLQTFFNAKGMPDQLFMYWEDVEFSRRVQQSGGSIGTLPHLQVEHRTQGAMSVEKTRYLVRNGAWYLANQTPLPWRIYWKAFNALRRAMHMRWTKKPAIARAIEEAKTDQLGK